MGVYIIRDLFIRKLRIDYLMQQDCTVMCIPTNTRKYSFALEIEVWSLELIFQFLVVSLANIRDMLYMSLQIYIIIRAL